MLLVVGCDRVSYGHATYADFILEEKIQVFKHKETKKRKMLKFREDICVKACGKQYLQRKESIII